MIFSPIIHCSALDYVAPHELQAMGINTIAVSILNLFQRPGWDWLIQHGGLQQFLGWSGTIIGDTNIDPENDLVEIFKQTANNLELRSKIDGRKITLNFTDILEIKSKLGINIGLEKEYFRQDDINYYLTKQFLNKKAIVSSAAPELAARRGELFTAKGILQIQQADYTLAFLPTENSCDCYTCMHFTQAYLRHLYLNCEMLAIRLITIHNISFLRKHIEEESL